MNEIKHFQSEERKGIAEEGEWTDQDLAVKADTPLVDSATGKKLILRMFDFKWDKDGKDPKFSQVKTDKQMLFNAHATYIKNMLWGDGLRPREDHDPKLIFTKKGYRIAILCEASVGKNIFEKGNTLQDILKKKKK